MGIKRDEFQAKGTVNIFNKVIQKKKIQNLKKEAEEAHRTLNKAEKNPPIYNS